MLFTQVIPLSGSVLPWVPFKQQQCLHNALNLYAYQLTDDNKPVLVLIRSPRLLSLRVSLFSLGDS